MRVPSAADEQRLGGVSVEAWDADVDLSALDPELASCTFNDPGILAKNGVLFLATQCQVFSQQGEVPEDEFVAVFAAPISIDSPVESMSWTFLGKLSDAADAAELGGENLLQTDLAFGQDGELLAIFSPSEPATPLAVHFGCAAVAVASLQPPTLARLDNGSLDVRAVVTAVDLQEVGGPGACAYEPASNTGLVIGRRSLTPGELVVCLHASGLQP